MMNLLHIDASARPEGSDQSAFGSHTRRLTARFLARWRAARPEDSVTWRDVGQHPPRPVSAEWIHAAFTKRDKRERWMDEALGESDVLVDELIRADLIVAGVPMYNFNVPSQFKAYIDNVVRVGRTFGFDRARQGDPYWPLLTDKPRPLVLISSRGDFGYDGGANAPMNHVEPSVRTAFAYIGIRDVRTIAVEYDEFADARLRASILQAQQRVDSLVDSLLTTHALDLDRSQNRTGAPSASAEAALCGR
jgi:FMN-dependent NADH-azoreductase